MTVTAQGGVFSLSPQTEKVGSQTWAENTFCPDGFYQYKTLVVDVGAQEANQLMPPEVGGTLYPTGAFKTGAFFGGRVQLLPRIEGDFGWILFALLGKAASATTAEAGVYAHTFSYDPDNQAAKMWFSARKYVPTEDGNGYGEQGYDCVMTGATIDIPQAGQIGVSLDILGRVPLFTPVASDWVYEDTAEDFQSIPLSLNGHIKIGGLEYPFTGAQVTINNQFTTVDQERVIGSPYPDDFASLRKMMTINTVYKWADPDLYNQLRTGTVSGTDWNPLPLITSTNGDTALEILVEAPGTIPSKTSAYGMTLNANRIVMRADGAPRLEGGNLISLPLVIDVLEPASGDYLTVKLLNEVDSYTWPT